MNRGLRCSAKSFIYSSAIRYIFTTACRQKGRGYERPAPSPVATAIQDKKQRPTNLLLQRTRQPRTAYVESQPLVKTKAKLIQTSPSHIEVGFKLEESRVALRLHMTTG